MDLIAKREELQLKANALAVEESNLAERIETLRALERRAVEVNRTKHQTLGAIAAIDEMIRLQAEEQKNGE